jgi:hypothetical protein
MKGIPRELSVQGLMGKSEATIKLAHERGVAESTWSYSHLLVELPLSLRPTGVLCVAIVSAPEPTIHAAFDENLQSKIPCVTSPQNVTPYTEPRKPLLLIGLCWCQEGGRTTKVPSTGGF